MIGVVAGERDLASVREYFELLKAPWECCRTDRRYRVVVAGSLVAVLPEADVAAVCGLDPKK